jgi:Phosphoesterase family
MVTRFVRSRAGARDRSMAARSAKRRMLGVGAATVAVLGAGIPLIVSDSAGAHGAAHHASGQAAVIAKLPAQARHAIRAHEHVNGRTYFDGLGIRPGKIKHVWLIILENKSYDASFTGLNNNTYLWKTLPSQGVLLKNFYGTGHDSLDNYISMASGQAPMTDDQSDCPDYSLINGSVDYSGNLDSNTNYGQLASAAGPNVAPGQNGCVYPSSVTTLFNQLDSAGVSWKGYAQDLGNQDASGPTHDAGTQYCGAPYASAPPAPDKTQPNPGSANSTDQYVPKHFPFPWFESILQSGDCNAAHIADVFSPTDGLYHDLQSERTTPAFSWITPNNCSDAHDAVCHGNNLSGGFSDPNTPNAPVNYTGGLYAADLFLEHIIPEIEASPAYKDGGLIDITFDEAFPPFTYTGNSFADSTDQAPNYTSSLISDSAGETLFGDGVDYEPTGPNVPLQTNAQGDELYPGPGFNAYIDRPGGPSGCQPYGKTPPAAGVCLLGSGGTPATDFPQRTDPLANAPAGTSTITDNPAVANPPTPANTGIQADDQGRAVSGSGIPAGSFVGPVTAVPTDATAPSGSPGGTVYTASFELVDDNGNPVLTTGPVSGITLAADTAQTDPLFTATGETNGGGDVGNVLISSYIKPGTSSYDYYNHYSWLRTMEDLFGVGYSSPGLDGLGHIGYAAQPGLTPFGPDVFNNPSGQPRRVVLGFGGGWGHGSGHDSRPGSRHTKSRRRGA